MSISNVTSNGNVLCFLFPPPLPQLFINLVLTTEKGVRVSQERARLAKLTNRQNTKETLKIISGNINSYAKRQENKYFSIHGLQFKISEDTLHTEVLEIKKAVAENLLRWDKEPTVPELVTLHLGHTVALRSKILNVTNLRTKIKQRRRLKDAPPHHGLLGPLSLGKKPWHTRLAPALKVSAWRWYPSHLFTFYGLNSEWARMCNCIICQEKRGTGIKVSNLHDLILVHKNCLSHILYYYPHWKYKY